MITNHPLPRIQKNQDDFLNKCPDSEKDFHARLFRIGNVAYRYHRRANLTNEEALKIYFNEWLEGLPESIREAAKSKGFELCKTMLPFTRYVNERADLGMDEWMKQHLPENDYTYYKSGAGTT